jgi:hypothetical protein
MTNGESEPSGAIPVGYYALRLLDEISSWLAASGTYRSAMPRTTPPESRRSSNAAPDPKRSYRVLHSGPSTHWINVTRASGISQSMDDVLFLQAMIITQQCVRSDFLKLFAIKGEE